MTIPIYIGIAALLFIIGIVLVLKGIPSEEEKAVLISNLHEIRELKETFVPSEKNEPQVALRSDVTPKEQPQVNQCMDENHQLRKEILEEKERYAQLERQMGALKKEYDQAKEQTKETIGDLKEETAKLSAQNKTLASNGGMLDKLQAKTELLETQYGESRKQLAKMAAAIEQLRTEKNELLTQMKIDKDQAAEQFNARTTAANKTEFQALSDKLVESIAAIEELKRENKNLGQSNWSLKEEFKKVEELNAHLMKKEKMMQYELTKNRAQALGLEKICADFRARIETMAASATTPG